MILAIQAIALLHHCIVAPLHEEPWPGGMREAIESAAPCRGSSVL